MKKAMRINLYVPMELKSDVAFLEEQLSDNIREYIDFNIHYSLDPVNSNEDLRRANEITEGIYFLLNDLEKTGIYADGELFSIYFPKKDTETSKNPSGDNKGN